MEQKISTKLVHEFDIDSELMENLDFTVKIDHKTEKVKVKVINITKSSKNKRNVKQGLF